jgi:NADH-quinone oxidoreductase subunit H
VILIPFGLWVILDGFRYETVLGRLVLPAVGTVVTALGLVFIVLPHVNAFIQAPFWFLSKVLLFLFIYVWMRGTLPRFRYDQLMSFGWKLLLPLSLVNVALTSFLVAAKMQWGAK